MNEVNLRAASALNVGGLAWTLKSMYASGMVVNMCRIEADASAVVNLPLSATDLGSKSQLNLETGRFAVFCLLVSLAYVC